MEEVIRIVLEAVQRSQGELDKALKQINSLNVANKASAKASDEATKIFNRHKGKSAAALAKDLRDDIDLHVVTANHWGQAREDLKTERHQRLLSDLFGTLHQSTWPSSPVSMLRDISNTFGFSLEQSAA